jgi:hypothetical protein
VIIRSVQAHAVVSRHPKADEHRLLPQFSADLQPTPLSAFIAAAGRKT